MASARFMKAFLRAVLMLGVLFGAMACSGPLDDALLERTRQTPDWFDDAKLGVFIHWGPASVPAFAAGDPLQPGDLEALLSADSPKRDLPYAEWYLNAMSYPGSVTALHHAQHYQNAPYTDFKPTFESNVNQGWDPDAWADLFAKAGARYVVLVTKHHDGYTLWPSDVAHPTRTDWGSPRDMVGELAEAVRAKGMRFGTYYSTGLDWSFSLETDEDWVRGVMLSAPASQAYADYAHDHLAELIDRYQPDLLWADIGYPSKGRLDELLAYYFESVPDGAVNDRWASVDVLGQIARIPGATWLMKALARWSLENQVDPLADDPNRIGFKTAEYDSLPGISPFKWEATRGLGSSFAFDRRETSEDMLSSAELVEFLVDTVAKNGNVLINVGPDSFGRIPAIQQSPLLAMGEWMAVNGQAIYATQPWERGGNVSGRALRYTKTVDALYAIVLGDVDATFSIENPGIDFSEITVLGAQLLASSVKGDAIELTLDGPLRGPAVVVRYALTDLPAQ
ncbi:MAG: alpha-L-fucosidase [Halioglobus sp.]